ncbi:hypothetical protein [Stakelama marina]|uniref:Uncharacterized protein n=1 Tax=Stakelama marina TaxID=2826939 RepID=A0A8T4IGU9_9SPHN|nr:hypothetical protein [Stakelama marina]MBR0553721.1 hypothetical protein [Stakelama marina]
MNPLVFGVVAGMVFGAIDVALMLPLAFADKRAALTGAFLSRFAIGFLISLVKMPLPTWAVGAIVATLVSLPYAVITKAFVPVLGTGLIGGLLIGWAAGRWAG